MYLSLIDYLQTKSITPLLDSATIFHHPAWQKTIAKAYGFKPGYIMFDEQSSANASYVLPVMQVKRHVWVSLPFTDYCMPSTGSAYSAIDLRDTLNQLRKNLCARTMEIRWPLPAGENAFLGESFYWHKTALSPDPDSVFKRFKRTQVQQCINKAEKDGVMVRKGTSWEYVMLFYRLHLQTRRRLGVPIQPLRYFRSMWKNIIDQDLGYILLAYQGEQLLAGAVFLHWKHTLTYKYSASDDRFWKLRANNLMLWYAIRWGCENGYQVFDWGRTDLEDEGLRDFKLGWGSEEQMLQYTILADHPPRLASRGRLRKAMKIIIQHSPLFVCRIMGELLYRFAA